MSSKLKVVWICKFSNAEIQQYIKPNKNVPEHAPWISSMIQLFESSNEVDLHVISQHEYLKTSKTFSKKGVRYYFVSNGIPFIGRHWPRIFKFDLWTNYSFWKNKTKKLVSKIRPDIIHLHGFENEFSGSILQFKNKYPVFVTIQGFINFSKGSSKKIDFRKKQELDIIKSFHHFGIRTETMGKDLKKFNKKAQLHWHSYPMIEIHPLNLDKKYDLVFFARMSKDKGIVDLIKALVILKNSHPSIRLCAIGGGKTEAFQSLAKELNVDHLIDWVGFLPTQEDVHKMASRAKLSILPTYHDIISGTIIESLFLKIPVVAYNVGSIHELNKNEKAVSLVEKKDIEGLAKEIKYLLSNPSIIEDRKVTGYKVVTEMFGEGNLQIKDDILNIYDQVIIDFKENNG